jgi:DNA polymerase gamma 1
LTQFVGYLDLETTGLLADSVILCACGVGIQAGTPVSAIYIGDGTSIIPITDSVIANWNQPFDRQFYPMRDDLTDPNWHIDLMGLQLAVRGIPEEWSTNTREDWVGYTAPDNSLKTAALRVGVDMDKGIRDQLVAGESIDRIDLLRYCWIDATTTAKVGWLVLEEYLAMAPNPLSLYGHMLRHRFLLPISKQWDGYVDRSEEWYQQQMVRLGEIATERLIEVCTADDPIAKNIRDNWPEKYEPIKKKRPPMIENNPILPTILERFGTLDQHMFKFLWEPLKFGSAKFTMLLGLHWFEDPDSEEGYPIFFDRSKKEWSYIDREGKKQILPNKEDAKKTLSTPLGKTYEGEIKSGKLRATGAKETRSLLTNTMRWKMFRGRVSDLRVRSTDQGYYLIPTYSPTGTLSGRSTDKVTLLIGSPKFEYGGSEFMSMIEAREGYRIVQADLDSAELVLGGLLATYYAGLPSELDDPFAEANLVGDKEASTDTHSLVANMIGIARKYAKNTVYGGMYFQGRKGRIQKLVVEGLSPIQAAIASENFEQQFINGLASNYFSGNRALTSCAHPTLLLGRNLPLAYLHGGRDGMTSRWNHNIQALGEDMLCVISALVEFRIGGYHGGCNLILTRHDELIFHCREDLIPELTHALQWAHLNTRRALMQLLGITQDAPIQWMFFQGVESNKRYLKSAEDNPSTCTTTFED